MATTTERLDDLEREVADLKAQLADLTAFSTDQAEDGDDTDGRGKVLALHRQVEALAHHLNFPLPQG